VIFNTDEEFSFIFDIFRLLDKRAFCTLVVVDDGHFLQVV